MRSIAAACAALLSLSACSGEEGGGAEAKEPEDATSSASEPTVIDDVCALLSVDEASRIVGVTYEDAEPEAHVGDYEVCAYDQAPGGDRHPLTLGVGSGSLEQTLRGLAWTGDATQEPIDVEGADAAALVTVDYGDNTVDQLVAEAGGNIYVVTLDGETDVAAELLAAAIGSS